MVYIDRLIKDKIKKTLKRKKSILLLGPRQTGKTTLIEDLKGDLLISLTTPRVRQKYEKNPDLLEKEILAINQEQKIKSPLIMLDEVQRVPELMDVAQYITDKKMATFVLTGSSARKLRRNPNINLLPGRVISLRLDPLTIAELPKTSLMELLMYGSLPGIFLLNDKSQKEEELESYVTTYLEEEIRQEAIVRNVGPFARFLELAASESGDVINLRKLSQEIGVSHTTIGSYYEILEDCLIIERIEPITKSKTRKKLTKSQKYLFFDLGVRRVAAREGINQPRELLGKLFEQFIGLELIRHARLISSKIKLRFFRDPDGPEVDWVIEKEGTYIPVETKWTEVPKNDDVRHLKTFLKEYSNSKKGYVVCQCSRKFLLDENILAIPWQEIKQIVTS